MWSVAHSSAVVVSGVVFRSFPSARCNATSVVGAVVDFDYWVGTRAGIGIRSASVWVVGVVLVSLDALVQSRQE